MMDETKVYNVINEVENEYSNYKDVIETLTKPYTEKLDKLIDNFSLKLFDSVTDDVNGNKHQNFYETFVLTGTVCLYDMIEEFNNLDLHKEICKLMHDKKYNESYVDYSNNKSLKRTVTELTSLSELDSDAEKTVLQIYESAISTIKQKMLTVKQLIDYISKISLMDVTVDKKTILNE